MSRTVLITGSAGFIGYHLARALLDRGDRVIGLDALTDYYDVSLKTDRHAMLTPNPNFTEVIGRIETPGLLRDLFETQRPDAVVHLAAQAGVRYSIEAPHSYTRANVEGHLCLLELARHLPGLVHMVYASSS